MEISDIERALDEHAIVAVTDPHGRITYVNDRFCEISKFSREELLGQDHRIVNSGFHPAEFMHDLWATVTRGDVWKGELRNRAKDGTFFWVNATIVPFFGEQGALQKFVAIFADITRQKVIEEQMRALNQELESRVVSRTSELLAAINALELEIAERKRLESEVLKISEHEQSRIGQDLHDDACQNLHGIALLAEVAARELERENSPTSDKVREICRLVRRSAEEVWEIAAGLFPVKVDFYGLDLALQELASESSARCKINCSFTLRHPVTIGDQNTAIQLYRIAQEAISNAVRHGHAKNVSMELSVRDETVSLTILDDGTGVSPQPVKNGLGLHTMQYRARILGGSLEVGPATGGGTTVICSFPGKESSYVSEASNSKEEDISR